MAEFWDSLSEEEQKKLQMKAKEELSDDEVSAVAEALEAAM